MTTKLSAADIAEIGQTLALFSHVCDNRQDDALGLVFTEDVVFEFARSGRTLRGLGEVREFLRAVPPDAPNHQTQDTAVLVDEDGTVRALSRYLAILVDGSVTNGDYEDVLVRLDAGWRIRSRRSVHRYPREAGEQASTRGEAWLPSLERLPSLLA